MNQIVTPMVTIPPITKIVMATLAISIFPLIFHFSAKEPATIGKARAINTKFQNPNRSIGIVKPMPISSNPKKKEMPEPDKK